MKKKSFEETLTRFVERTSLTPRQLSLRTKIPKETIKNWLKGRVRKPRKWEDIVKLARAMHLDISDASILLKSAEYPTISDLLSMTTDSEGINLLNTWRNEISKSLDEIPFDVMPDLPHFVGRDDEILSVSEELVEGRHNIISLEGMAGVGKSVLAARIAYLTIYTFPDGVLWAQLDSTDTMSIMNSFAFVFKEDASRFTKLEDRCQLLRQILANKKSLIILDNATSSAEIKPLLPPSGKTAVIVTTRHRNLSALRGARKYEINPFKRKTGDAFRLFKEHLGEKRTDQDTAELERIAEILGYLPLALDIVASRLAYEPHFSSSEMLGKLEFESERLNELEYEDLSVRVSVSISYDMLIPELRLVFPSLCVFNGNDFDASAFAYISEITNQKAMTVLRELYSLSLVQQARQGRFRLHPLINDFAYEKLVDTKPIERMVEFFVEFVERNKMAYSLLDIERDNVIVSLNQAIQNGMHSLTIRGVNAFADYLYARGTYDSLENYLRSSLKTAEISKDDIGLINTLHNIGRLENSRGNYQDAEEKILIGLNLSRENRLVREEIKFLANLGTSFLNRGKFPSAKKHYQNGLSLAQKIDDKAKICDFHMGLGAVADSCAEYDEAKEQYKKGLLIARDLNLDEKLPTLLANLGGLAIFERDIESAETYLQEGIEIARNLNHSEYISLLLTLLGEAAQKGEDFPLAEEYYSEGYALAEKIGHTRRKMVLLLNLGSLFGERDDAKKAIDYLRKSLKLAEDTNQRWFIASIHIKLGEIYLDEECWDNAFEDFTRAEEIARELDNKEFLGQAKFGLAKVTNFVGNKDEAIKLARESETILKEIGYKGSMEVTEWIIRLDPK